MRYSFDDLNIGRARDGNRCLETREIPRPPGFKEHAHWYAYATGICEVLNGAKNIRADTADLETANKLTEAQLDITGAELVQVAAKDDGSVLWININGVCALRVCRIPKGALQFGSPPAKE